MEWLEFLEWDETRRTKLDYYLAQIAAQICRGQVKNPRTIKTNDFLIEMQTQTELERAKKSKAAWGLALGIKMDQN